MSFLFSLDYIWLFPIKKKGKRKRVRKKASKTDEEKISNPVQYTLYFFLQCEWPHINTWLFYTNSSYWLWFPSIFLLSFSSSLWSFFLSTTIFIFKRHWLFVHMTQFFAVRVRHGADRLRNMKEVYLCAI